MKEGIHEQYSYEQYVNTVSNLPKKRNTFRYSQKKGFLDICNKLQFTFGNLAVRAPVCSAVCD